MASSNKKKKPNRMLRVVLFLLFLTAVLCAVGYSRGMIPDFVLQLFH
jgi:hypothetical protein